MFELHRPHFFELLGGSSHCNWLLGPVGYNMLLMLKKGDKPQKKGDIRGL
jgi:hypothetical protein